MYLNVSGKTSPPWHLSELVFFDLSHWWNLLQHDCVLFVAIRDPLLTPYKHERLSWYAISLGWKQYISLSHGLPPTPMMFVVQSGPLCAIDWRSAY